MKEILREYVDSRGVKMRVDRGGGIIRGVKILGRNSRNGRRYPTQTLLRAVELYEGAKVNVNHAKGAAAGPRDYQDRIGAIRGVRVRPEEGLFADFHFNPKHALAEQLIWDAQHAPENVGFSHNVRAKTVRRGDQVEVESIDKVQSVDLVADPATTAGLFESQPEEEDGNDSSDADQSALDRLTVESLRIARPDLVEQLLSQSRDELQSLRRELKELRESASSARRDARIRELLAEFNLPYPETVDECGQAIVGKRFMRSLHEAADEEAVHELIVERAELVRRLGGADSKSAPSENKPLSRDQIRFEEMHDDADSFVKAIT
ncbi:MAG: hypothetical protein U9N87_05050 [Planctomycetota bacterium]|nr:hypothetical protein [Planctomycetota bacterium]